MYIKLLSTGACANINIREIMLISIISSASWTLKLPLTLGYWTASGLGAELLGGQHKSMELSLTLRYWAVPESGVRRTVRYGTVQETGGLRALHEAA